MAEKNKKVWTWIILLIVLLLLVLLAALLISEYTQPGPPIRPYCGNNVCEAGENEVNCPQDCKAVVKPVCGDNKCGGNETWQNCNEDCCAPEDAAIGPPFNCCPGLVAIQGEAFSIKYCTKCGDGICRGRETKDNCPSDCKEEQPSISRGIYGYISLLTGDCMPPIGPSCKKEFIETKVKVYSLISSDEMNGTYYVGQSLGWFDSVTQVKIKSANCRGCEALCLYNGSKSEGWYDSCQDTTNITASLIRYEQCSKGTPKPYCKITKKTPIATTTSKTNGFYEFGLSNGAYSVFAEDPTVESDNNEYCNSFSDNKACTVTINNNKVRFDISIDHAAH